MGKCDLNKELLLYSYKNSIDGEKEYSDKLDRYILLISFGVLSGWFSLLLKDLLLKGEWFFLLVPLVAIVTMVFCLYCIRKSKDAFTQAIKFYTLTYKYEIAEGAEKKKLKSKIKKLAGKLEKNNLSVKRWNYAMQISFVLLLVIIVIGGLKLWQEKQKRIKVSAKISVGNQERNQ